MSIVGWSELKSTKSQHNVYIFFSVQCEEIVSYYVIVSKSVGDK